jgi:hypothetical protein
VAINFHAELNGANDHCIRNLADSMAVHLRIHVVPCDYELLERVNSIARDSQLPIVSVRLDVEGTDQAVEI